MKSAALISIGNELLSGETVDTNVSYLCRHLLLCGIPTVNIFTVPDEISSIVDAFEQATRRADVVLVTGGLGPTGDDVTREALAAFLKVELRFCEDLQEQIAGFFARRGFEMAPSNRIQAFLPAGARALQNSQGTAPGIAVDWQGRFIACMPGVPAEMKQMFSDHLNDYLKQLAGGQSVAARKLMCYGAGESTIASMLGERMERGRNPLVNSTAQAGLVTIHIVAAAAEQASAEQMVEHERAELCQILGNIIYGYDGQTMAEVVGAALADRGKTLAIAESCTGGLLGQLITDVPGSSRYFKCGWITYSNEAKSRDLDVDSGLLEQCGAVSEEVAQAMALGARKKAGADYGIAITGIAGPDGGTEAKPVGLVYIALNTINGSRCERFVFPFTRPIMRLRTALAALNMLRLEL
ncbi:MAG: competence/damage-inducible protein A [Phycisphaerae bacterium]|nr:competence/damage-inducible protein A [Phycisphaerae bacterium]